MATYIETLIRGADQIAPRTKTSAVSDDNGTSLEAILGAKQPTITDLATIRSGATAGATALQPPPVKTVMDAVAVAGAKYFLGEQSAVSITMPTDALLGQEIVVNFSSGATASTLSCDLTGFDFVPKANKTNKITFTLIEKGATSADDKWSVEIKEG